MPQVTQIDTGVEAFLSDVPPEARELCVRLTAAMLRAIAEGLRDAPDLLKRNDVIDDLLDGVGMLERAAERLRT